jgi:hypothetical protein
MNRDCEWCMTVSSYCTSTVNDCEPWLAACTTAWWLSVNRWWLWIHDDCEYMMTVSHHCDVRIMTEWWRWTHDNRTENDEYGESDGEWWLRLITVSGDCECITALWMLNVNGDCKSWLHCEWLWITTDACVSGVCEGMMPANDDCEWWQWVMIVNDGVWVTVNQDSV